MEASDRRKQAAEEAAEWWVTLQGEVSRAQRERYVDWLRESAVHVSEMLRVAQVHGALSRFKRWGELPSYGSGDAPATIVPLLHPAASGGGLQLHPRPRWRPLAVAATVLLAVVLGVGYLIAQRGQIIETERGERREVALPDGSVVQVDPETRVRLAYEPGARRVYLDRGRALFHVAKNPARPFLVQTQDATVRAVGTAFGVEQTTGVVVVTVSEGRVAVIPTHNAGTHRAINDTPRAGSNAGGAPRGPGSAAPARDAESGRSAQAPSTPTASTVAGEIFLVENEQVTVADSGVVPSVREVDSSRALAWADGRLVFDNDSVDHAVREFNRYNRIQLTVNDPALARRAISGVFSAADPESFVAFLQSVAAVHVTHDDAADIIIDAPK